MPYSTEYGVLQCSVVAVDTWVKHLQDTLLVFLHNNNININLNNMIPIWPLWQQQDVLDAFYTAGTDTYQAFVSLARLLYVVFYPLFVFTAQIVTRVLLYFYNAWIKKGGLQRACWTVWQLERSLTQRQFLLQVACVALVALLLALRKYLIQSRLIQRARIWMRWKKLRAQQSFRLWLIRISRVSTWLAYMVPHGLHVAICIGVKLLLPRIYTYLACDSPLVLELVSWWYPLLATLWNVHKSNSIEDDNTPRAAVGRKKDKKKDERLLLEVLQQQQQQQQLLQLQHWLDYWTTVATYTAAVSVLGTYTYLTIWIPLSVQQALLQVQLALFVWLITLHHYPTLVEGEDDADAAVLSSWQSPLSFVARKLASAAYYVQHSVAAIVQPGPWTACVVTPVSSLLQMATMIGVIAPATQQQLVAVTAELRTVLLPALVSLIPGGVGARLFALPYVQLALSISKTNNYNPLEAANQHQNKVQFLVASCQYWILHTFLSAALNHSSTSTLRWWLAWIPCWNLMLVLMWWYLSFPSTVQQFYGLLVEEMERLVVYAFHHLDHNTGTAGGQEVEQQQLVHDASAANNNKAPPPVPRVVTAFDWIVRKLPSAHDLKEKKNNADDDNIENENTAEDDENANRRRVRRRVEPEPVEQHQQQEEQVTDVVDESEQEEQDNAIAADDDAKDEDYTEADNTRDQDIEPSFARRSTRARRQRPVAITATVH